MLTLRPVSLAEANAFVAEHHRHHKPVRGHKFSLGCMVDGQLVGVAIVGRPVSRYLDDGLTLEVNRLCTDGTQWRKSPGGRLEMRRPGRRQDVDRKTPSFRTSVSRTNEIPI